MLPGKGSATPERTCELVSHNPVILREKRYSGPWKLFNPANLRLGGLTAQGGGGA